MGQPVSIRFALGFALGALAPLYVEAANWAEIFRAPSGLRVLADIDGIPRTRVTSLRIWLKYDFAEMDPSTAKGEIASMLLRFEISCVPSPASRAVREVSYDKFGQVLSDASYERAMTEPIPDSILEDVLRTLCRFALKGKS